MAWGIVLQTDAIRALSVDSDFVVSTLNYTLFSNSNVGDHVVLKVELKALIKQIFDCRFSVQVLNKILCSFNLAL